MKRIFVCLGMLSALAGTGAGLVNWYLTEHYLETVGWSGPMMLINSVAWFANVLGLGLGVVLIGIASLDRFQRESP